MAVPKQVRLDPRPIDVGLICRLAKLLPTGLRVSSYDYIPGIAKNI